MDSLKFQDVRAEKANAMAKYRRIQRITGLFRYVELFVFLIVVSRFSAQFAVFVKLAGDFFRGISVISPGSVFVVGNAIVIVLFLISRQFSGERSTDFYDEYVEKCRSNSNQQQQAWMKPEARRAPDERKAICRTRSANLERERERVQGRDLRRSMSDKCRKIRTEEEMSSEEFRHTVEAFIARQQRFLREEEGLSALVSFQP